MIHEHRTWFPFIVIGVTLCLVLVIVIWKQPSATSVDSDQSTVEVHQVITEEEYQQLVRQVLNDFETSHDSAAAHEALLDIFVPAAYKDIHLELVIIIAKYQSGEDEEAQARLDLLAQQYDWLNL